MCTMHVIDRRLQKLKGAKDLHWRCVAVFHTISTTSVLRSSENHLYFVNQAKVKSANGIIK